MPGMFMVRKYHSGGKPRLASPPSDPPDVNLLFFGAKFFENRKILERGCIAGDSAA